MIDVLASVPAKNNGISTIVLINHAMQTVATPHQHPHTHPTPPPHPHPHTKPSQKSNHSPPTPTPRGFGGRPRACVRACALPQAQYIVNVNIRPRPSHVRTGRGGEGGTAINIVEYIHHNGRAPLFPCARWGNRSRPMFKKRDGDEEEGEEQMTSFLSITH